MIIFKVWCKDRKEWEKDEVFLSALGSQFHTRRLLPVKSDNHLVFFSTGRKDKKGKEIYYGSDIVKFKVQILSLIPKYIELIGIFHFHEDELRTEIEIFGHPDYTTLWYDYITMNNFEIIGTVQENPELLDKKIKNENE
jgi:uncharacterized phage protein (TIGR01671 family)